MTRGRTFDPLSAAQLAADRLEPRRVVATACFRPGQPQPVGALLDAIQHVAEAATGERSFLHIASPNGSDRRDRGTR